MVTTPVARLLKPSRRSKGLAALGVPRTAGPLYDLALTHRSYAFERPNPIPHNERLEFLGDAVLGAVVTDLLYRSFPDLQEGDLARLRAAVVNTHSLAELARALDVGERVKLGRGEEASGGRNKDSILACAFEAIVGAVYLDRGMRVTRKSLVPMFSERVEDLRRAGALSDPKTQLQEVTVKRMGSRPSYRVGAFGPDHAKRFTAQVYVEDELYGAGGGRSKKEAEQNAARQALTRLAEGGSDARAS